MNNMPIKYIYILYIQYIYYNGLAHCRHNIYKIIYIMPIKYSFNKVLHFLLFMSLIIIWK